MPLSRRLALAALPAPALARPAAAQQAPEVLLFRIVSPRDEIVIGLTPAELAVMGSGPEVERIARRLAAEGQLGVWRYVVGRSPAGEIRYGTTGRIAILRQDTLRIEPYIASIPVVPPPPPR